MVNGSFDYFERYTMQTSRASSKPSLRIQDLDDLGGPCTLSLHPFTIGGFKWFESCEMEATITKQAADCLRKILHVWVMEIM